MKTTINLQKWLLALTVLGAISFASCKKEISTTAIAYTTEEETITLNAVTADAETEAQFDDVFNITASINTGEAGEDLGMGTNVSGLFELGTRTDSLSQRCFTVTVVPRQPGVFPKTVTIDFGNGCLGRDGKFRKGKIVTIYTNRMLIPGAKISTSFVNYFVDSFKIEGTHITENTSTSNKQGLLVKVIDGKIINTNANTWIKWNSEKNILQIEGNGTPNFPLDDVYKITGNARGANSIGHSWAANVKEPLIKKFTCRWIVKGTVHLIKNGKEALLDYGNGDCDRKAIIYINGRSHIIIL